MHNDKESPFTLTLLDGGLSLQVLQFSGREGLNQPYRFDIDVIGLAPAMHLDQWLQQPAFLRLADDQGIHGMIHSVSREHRGPHRVGYSLVLTPHLQHLDRHSLRRVFHRLSVPAIVRQLLEEHQLPEHSYRFELANGCYPPGLFAFSTMRAIWPSCSGCVRKKASTITSNISPMDTYWCWPMTA
jgi:Uncharacterized protein conserved in bacteria